MPQAWLSSRVSSGPQSRGGGHRRQESADAVAAAERWCRRHGYDLQGGLRFTGSAYRGKHMAPGAPQREWLERAIRGELGDRPALLVEQVDRLTRQAGHEADGGLAELLYRAFPAGVVIVDLGDDQTYSTEAFDRDDRLLGDLIEEARLAHRESVKKSRRLIGHWDQVRADIAAGRVVRPLQLAPWWVDGVDGRWELNCHADLARRIFTLALDQGSVQITRLLNAEQVPPPAHRQGPRWTASMVVKTMRNPAAWGCCCVKGLDPVPGVFPPLLTREQFDLVQARIEGRVGDLSTRGSKRQTWWVGAGVTRCVCGWSAGLVSSQHRGERTWRYVGCSRHRDHGRTCPARLLRLDLATAHLLTRLTHGQLANLLNDPRRDQRVVAAQATARNARDRLEVAGVERHRAEDAVRAAVLRGQAHDLLLELANDARAAEVAARQVAAEAAAEADALRVVAPAAPLEQAVGELFAAIAAGRDTPEQRQAVNRGLRALGALVTIDMGRPTPAMGLSIRGEAVDWQPVSPVHLTMLADGRAGVRSVDVGDAVATVDEGWVTIGPLEVGDEAATEPGTNL